MIKIYGHEADDIDILLMPIGYDGSEYEELVMLYNLKFESETVDKFQKLCDMDDEILVDIRKEN